ncbi:HD-GYP domain-containing protein [Pelosinus sp. sgz500959]|uniref:HD-GYP domain-containing protein n=1 Tax=Pelosinus sp. sgz500959 TaxID=3242472 RepID=UPI00366E5A6E
MLQYLVIDDEIIFRYPSKTKSEITNHLLNLISQYDIGTARHSYKVAKMAVSFAIKLNLSLQTVEDTLSAALLHDIGKIKIPKHILNKPGILTQKEFQIIKKHSQYGFEILNNTNQLKHLAEVVLCHHEKFNGKGYPNGKAGKEIPLIAQILSIIDVYEAITSDRIYRKAMTRKEAFQVIYDGMETHFNSTLVKKFLLERY